MILNACIIQACMCDVIIPTATTTTSFTPNTLRLLPLPVLVLVLRCVYFAPKYGLMPRAAVCMGTSGPQEDYTQHSTEIVRAWRQTSIRGWPLLLSAGFLVRVDDSRLSKHLAPGYINLMEDVP